MISIVLLATNQAIDPISLHPASGVMPGAAAQPLAEAAVAAMPAPTSQGLLGRF